MTGMEAIGLMLIDEKIIAVRSTTSSCALLFDSIAGNGINLTGEQLTNEIWEIGFECEECNGDGEITVPCPRCSAKSLRQLLEDPCCGGFYEVTCTECEGKGVIWSREY